jgi:antitoxin CptB
VSPEDRDTRLRRLAMRSMRRGTKEMDVILMRYFEAEGASLDAAALDRYEALLEEGDTDLYAWISGQTPPPERHAEAVAAIQALLPSTE